MSEELMHLSCVGCRYVIAHQVVRHFLEEYDKHGKVGGRLAG
jgi:hypothetical protein